MNLLEAIILGIVQGLTEFLPISSTGHLTLAGKFMNVISPEFPQRWTAFIAVIQLGTMAAVIYYFRNDLWKISIEFIKNNLILRKKFSEQTSDSRMGWYIIVGTIPIVLVGFLLKDFIEGAFTKNLYVISISLIVLGIILAGAEKLGKMKKEITNIKWYDSLLIGFGQAVALIPGSSRSGTTITTGLFLGLTREAAARFSFLLSIPAVLASGLLQFFESLEFLDSASALNLIISTLAAAVSGYYAIDFLLKYLRKNSTFIFVYYRVLLGTIILILLWSGIINA